MRGPHSVLRIAGCIVAVIAGLGLGFGAARRWEAKPPAPPAPGPGARPAAQAPPERPRAAAGKRALLVGVTKYDHLSKQFHLSGPGNDVRLVRRLLRERYQFPDDAIVTLSEDEGKPSRRPTRANIEHEFRRLAEQAQEGDQVMILLAGHGDRQPENNPPDPVHPEPDGIDEIFLPADVRSWNGFPDRVPNAIVDDEIGAWLDTITAKKAYVWIVFDCCHSGTMTRGTQVLRELKPGTLVPREELEKARNRAAQRDRARGKTRGGPVEKATPFIPRGPSDYLVALYACRPHETTPEIPQPPEAADAPFHGLLTYSLVDILTKSSTSTAPLTYRELIQRLQARYATRVQGAPTPTAGGKGQDRVVLGVDEPARPTLLLTRDKGGYKVNAGDLSGLTIGSVLAVYSPAGEESKPKLLGHVRVSTVGPFDARVEPCAYESMRATNDLPPLSSCQPVFLDYGLRRFKLALQNTNGEAVPDWLQQAVQPLSGAKGGLVDVVEDPRTAELLLRRDGDKVQLVEAGGNRAAFSVASRRDRLTPALRRDLEKMQRARNLIALATRFEEEGYRGKPIVDVKVELLRHKNQSAPGEVLPRPPEGWVFHPGEFISFRVHNQSRSAQLDVTLLQVGADYQISAYYPLANEWGKVLKPGASFDTPPGEINGDPPFGREYLVVIAAPATTPPVSFAALAQEGLPQARAADRSGGLRSPLGELMVSALYGTGKERGLKRSVAEEHGLRVLNWMTEPGKAERP